MVLKRTEYDYNTKNKNWANVKKNLNILPLNMSTVSSTFAYTYTHYHTSNILSLPESESLLISELVNYAPP